MASSGIILRKPMVRLTSRAPASSLGSSHDVLRRDASASSRALGGTALRPESVAKGGNRNQQENSAEREAGDQRIVFSREPNEGRNQ